MLPELTGHRRLPRVLVTGIGGPAAQAFVDAVRPETVEWHVADADPLAPGLTRFSPSRRSVIPRGEDNDFVASVLAVSAASGIDLIVPTVDAELEHLAAARHRFDEIGVRLLTSRLRPIRQSLDKWDLMTDLSGVVHIPGTALLDEKFDELGGDYPVIAKPRRGSGSRGIVLAVDPNGLSGLPRDETYIIQEYLPGPEYSLDVLARADGSVAAVVPRERLRTDSGVATVARTVQDPALIELGLRTVEAVGLTGIINVQCRLDRHGVPAVIEINPRVPGTIGLTVASGVNMPQLVLEEALGRPIPSGLRFEVRMLVRMWQQHIVDVDEFARLLSTTAASVA